VVGLNALASLAGPIPTRLQGKFSDLMEKTFRIVASMSPSGTEESGADAGICSIHQFWD
jgi:hypothetical protein